ncbi:5'-3' exonuclease pld3 [Bulinus truncatus]|nr:5'-3' exonuclease pld3 [Bulinus truncatus]
MSNSDTCIFTLVESIPENLTYSPGEIMLMPTYLAHKRLLNQAKKTIHLATFYWTLLADAEYADHSDGLGKDIFKNLMCEASKSSLELKIVQNNTNNETEKLASAGAQVRTLDFSKLLGSGVMHTKMWIVDGIHMYIGSANLDWRSYTQIKELGILIENCPTLVSDAEKLFEVYWYLANNPQPHIPSPWPPEYSTSINSTSPELLEYNQTEGYTYLSSSPKSFCPSGRTNDIDAILDVIRAADKFIYISVMDYLPIFMFTHPRKFWPVIDDELKQAAFDRNITVHLLISTWNHSDSSMYPFLKSLNSLGKISLPKVNLFVKLFNVPSFTESQAKIPYARVQHNKYMVTDKHVYIGTSNWSGDYFNSTGGVGFILKDSEKSPNILRFQLVDIFLRDWNSAYSHDLY